MTKNSFKITGFKDFPSVVPGFKAGFKDFQAVSRLSSFSFLFKTTLHCLRGLLIVKTWYFPIVFAFRFNRMTSFAFCGFLDVHFSSNGSCGCLSLAFPIFPIDVIQKSTSDAYIYTLMLTSSYAGYTIRKTIVLLVSDKKREPPTHGCLMITVWLLPGEARVKLGKTAEAIRRQSKYWSCLADLSP